VQHAYIDFCNTVTLFDENGLKKSTEALLDASKEVCLEVNLEKTKYMLMSCSRKIGKSIA
jgi:hypothetical protein